MTAHFGPDLVRSQPVPVFWLGFETDTYKMGRAGWRMAVEDTHYDRSKRVLFTHPTIRAQAIGEFRDDLRLPQPIRINALSTVSITFNLYGDIAPRFDEVTMVPYRTDEHTDIFRSAFGKIDSAAPKEIIVDTPTVMDLYQKILDLQQPEQDRIRAEKRRQTPRIEARILSFGA